VLRLWWCPERPTALARRARTDELLRTVLAPTVGRAPAELVFGREKKGRPFLRHDRAPDFNLTDTDGGGVIALCRRGRVGVDIERLDRLPPVARLARRWFSAAEAAQLAAMPEDDARRAFLRLWTAKEASCKATGTGIFGFLAAWCFDPLSDQPQAIELPADAGDASRWSFLRVLPAATHTAVVSVRDAGFARIEGYTLLD
jgi:4'-phosphopantetheinyl transferase